MINIHTIKDTLAPIACVNERSLRAFQDLLEPWFAERLLWNTDQIVGLLQDARRQSVEEGRLPYYPEQYASPLAALLAKRRTIRCIALPRQSDGNCWTKEEWRAYRAYMMTELAEAAGPLYDQCVAEGLESLPEVIALGNASLSGTVNPRTFICAANKTSDPERWRLSNVITYNNPGELAKAALPMEFV
jgi:hypothetical protein